MGIDEDGYSSFEAEDGEGRDLDELLKKRNITDLYICGLATDYCVKATALDAALFGYRTILLLDACRAVNLKQEDEENALEEMIRAGVKISSTGNVLEGLVNGN
jgi:nicotinamidase/pyrazinamidase